jgi:preflagellin peptidase FlaK
METFQIAEYASIALSLLFFTVSSAFDLKKREVSDWVWLVYGPLGLILTCYRLLIDPLTLMLVLVSIGLTTLISVALFYFNIFGGADAKAMICLGLTLPLAPNSYRSLVGYVLPIFPICVLTIGYVCSLSVAVWLGLRNLIAYSQEGSALFTGLEEESWWRKILAAISGYPDDVSNLARTFYLYPMERVEETQAKRKFHFFIDAETDRDEVVSKFIRSLEKVGSPQRVWVSPGLPMLVFILIGLAMALSLGDLFFSTMLRIGSLHVHSVM